MLWSFQQYSASPFQCAMVAYKPFFFCDRAVEMLILVAETPLVERKKLVVTRVPNW